MTDHEAVDSHSPSPRRKSAKGSSAAPTNSTCHFVLQGKGGIGKSLVASLLAQQLRDIGRPLVCLDTDVVNQSFVAVNGIKAEYVPMLDSENEIDSDVLNKMIERILVEPADFVIDNGASSFLPMNTYLIGQGLFGFLIANGKRVVVHTVVTGGPQFQETATAFVDICEQFPDGVEIVVWTNPFFGDVASEDGVHFEETRAYLDNADRISGTVRLPNLNPRFEGRVFQKLLKAKLTFEEGKTSSSFDLVSKLWLDQVRGKIWPQIAEAI